MYSIVIFGGTFDPVHNGHIQTSLSIQKEFQFDSYRFIPCKTPTIKPASTATPEQRVEMLHLALAHYKQFTIDLREINRQGPSYMVDTLESIRKESPEASISLIVGYDAFISLPRWHQWEKLFEFANLLVINRDAFNTELPTLLQKKLQAHQVNNKIQLLKQSSGAIYLFNAGTYTISSSQIRQALKEGQKVDQPIPVSVAQYIHEQGLYC